MKKHLIAVAIRELVLQAAQAGEMAMGTDGGAIQTGKSNAADDDDEPCLCDRTELGCFEHVSRDE